MEVKRTVWAGRLTGPAFTTQHGSLLIHIPSYANDAFVVSRGSAYRNWYASARRERLQCGVNGRRSEAAVTQADDRFVLSRDVPLFMAQALKNPPKWVCA